MLIYRPYSKQELEELPAYTIVAQLWEWQGRYAEPEIYRKRVDGGWHEMSTYSDEHSWTTMIFPDAVYAIIYDPRREE